MRKKLPFYKKHPFVETKGLRLLTKADMFLKKVPYFQNFAWCHFMINIFPTVMLRGGL